MWQPQVEYFSRSYRVITYDIRGHSETGGSARRRYSMELFADDLVALVDALKLDKPSICGISMGGMVAQAYAVKYRHQLRALVLADTAVSSALTPGDKLTVYVLAPKWLFLMLVRLLGMKRYTAFAFRYAQRSRGKEWVGRDQSVMEYEKEEMLKFRVDEFNKIFAAIYDFRLLDLHKIAVPTLVVNGEYESKAVFRHVDKMTDLINEVSQVVIPDAGHASNLENPAEFNRVVAKFLEGMTR
jgi:pimeloyl-ACP methyl ester carboxylesterase